MSVTTIDEETPLLPEQQKKKQTPLPWAQFSILLVLQLAEPLTNQVIYPFLPQLIRDVGITHGDETRVGYYAGVLQSIFFATQAMTVLHWSRLSDHIGRKPVIMNGLLGLSLSMYCLGLSRTFWGAVLSRSLNGALNGNIGVLKSMIAEITDSSNLAQAYSYLPIAWSTGGTLGPIIGGFLSKPHERFPDIFGNSEFLKTYPYFLACAVPATFSALAWLVSFLFLHETVPSPKSVRRMFGAWLSKENITAQTVSEGQDSKAIATVGITPVDDDDSKNKPLPLRELLIPRVILAALNYAFLALVDISTRAIQPVFFSTPVELGGLGLPPHHIGKILSVYGVINGFLQIFYFAKTQARFGPKNVYMAGIASSLIVFAFFPVINWLARTQGLEHPLVWLAVAIQIVTSILINFSYGCVFIYITASSPNRASLGTVNGFAQLGVSIMRAVGPAAANSLFSVSIHPDYHYLNGNLVYWVMSLVTISALVVGSYLPSKVWTADEEES
ncbi:member of major facilitator multidrug-resistance DHA1 sub-family [Irpex rosettiformis]|uniref:Member of major facilitator multidrug-resistance DHA1 sub-family n=1 Tax=Irpex rosettiformis TaxID=378272 RepID=A0ACB8UAS4_9APHY|nr:member of major facilitator multidrug-resistance DHA1 sub-family [Irpex rosettiformis]